MPDSFKLPLSIFLSVYYLYLQMMARMTTNTTQMEIVTKSTRNPDMRAEFYHRSEITNKVVIGPISNNPTCAVTVLKCDIMINIMITITGQKV